MTTMTDNIVALFGTATPIELAEGLDWYPAAHRLAVELDALHPERAAGVIAAMSPMMSWDRNAEVARNAYATGIVTGGLFSNCAKAQSCMAGTNPLDVIKGNKTRAFFLTIVNPAVADVVVIDRHAHDVAVGRVTDDATRKGLTSKRVYATFANAYLDAATILGYTPSQVQAVTWVVWRNIHATGWAKRDANVAA